MFGRVEARGELVGRRQHRGAAVQPHDPRRTLERAEHDDDAAVLARVRDRLCAAADEVEISNLVRPEDSEPAQVALWRHVDVAVLGERRRGDEEEMLLLDPAGELVVDLRMDLPHDGSVAFGHAHAALRSARDRAPDRPRADGRCRRTGACGRSLECGRPRTAAAHLGCRSGRSTRDAGADVPSVRRKPRARVGSARAAGRDARRRLAHRLPVLGRPGSVCRSRPPSRRSRAPYRRLCGRGEEGRAGGRRRRRRAGLRGRRSCVGPRWHDRARPCGRRRRRSNTGDRGRRDR